MPRSILLALLLAATAHAQWSIQQSNTTADLRGIDNVGHGIAWASGSNGTVLHTTDNGATWLLCKTPPDAEHLDFRGIQAFDATTAIVMSSGKGDLSRLYKTTDGCQTWKLIFTNPDIDGFWDAFVMTDKNIGMLIGDPIPPSTSQEAGQTETPVFPTYHTINGGETWSRNDHEHLHAIASPNGQALESIFAASNSSFLLLPYTEIFVTGGIHNGLHYEQYTFEHVTGICPYHNKCDVDQISGSALASGETAGGFSVAANWKLGAFPSTPELRKRPSDSVRHTVVLAGGDYKNPDTSVGTASYCDPREIGGGFQGFRCLAATTPPHGYRSAVAYDALTKTWITVGPNGTDISTDDGRNWRALKPSATDTPDADQHWNALSLPFVVGPHGRIGILRVEALQQPAEK